MGEDTEERIRALCDSGARGDAATLALEAYGGGILAFLIARLRSESDAEEVFAIFCEKLWMGLPGFEWRCQLQGWAYMLARNAANDYKTAAHNRPQRRLPLSRHSRHSQLVQRARTTTRAYRRTQARDRVRALRESLPEDDQMLLVLRVDQGMAWRELAAAMHDGESLPAPAELDRNAARLRKRFERIKEKLRAMADAEGLL